MLKPYIDGRYPTAAGREQALADWYGEDQAVIELAAVKRPPRGIQALLRKAVRAIDDPDRRSMRELWSQWSTIVGSEYIRWTRPGKIVDYTLIIEVWHPAALFRLNGQQARMLAAVQQVAAQVRAVRLVPGGSTPNYRQPS